jgi:glycerol-3-phosphate acyltransferase PlsY
VDFTAGDAEDAENKSERSMAPYLLSLLFVLLAYLIGAVPFAYLTAYWVGGIDIRTVGSGNVGATNVGRVLGFRYFLLVFALDLLKGWLPTWGMPKAVAALTGTTVPWLAVAVALATILGHNFPIYLRFRGGKGVATSLGAVSALDPYASVATAVAFVVFLLITRIVSISSVMGAFVFSAVHFVRVDRPWDRDQVAMTVLTIALVGMLIVRHRKNFARIAAGTEPKVSFRKKRPGPPSGRAGVIAVVGLALLGACGAALAYHATRRVEADLGPFRLVEVARAATGHQRAERIVFADRGQLLAVACPRYNRVALYRVTEAESLSRLPDLALEGRPVALWATPDRLYVLQRPAGDARHLEEGYWETFDLQGRRVGSKVRVGWDPDDLVITPGGRLALVLTSGHAEGETNRPAPALAVFDLATNLDAPRVIGRVSFDGPNDDPERLILSSKGTHAAVALRGSGQVVGVSLADPARPEVTGRLPLPGTEAPYLSMSGDEAIVMPVASDREAVVIDPAGSAKPTPFVVSTLPDESGVEVHLASGRHPLGRLTLHGPANLGTIRPTGLAYAPGRGLLAVANRSGGVHLIAVRAAKTDGGN